MNCVYVRIFNTQLLLLLTFTFTLILNNILTVLQTTSFVLLCVNLIQYYNTNLKVWYIGYRLDYSAIKVLSIGFEKYYTHWRNSSSHPQLNKFLHKVMKEKKFYISITVLHSRWKSLVWAIDYYSQLIWSNILSLLCYLIKYAWLPIFTNI